MPQVLTVWLGTMITGSFLSQLNQWIAKPSSAVNILGTAVPKVCTAAWDTDLAACCGGA